MVAAWFAPSQIHSVRPGCNQCAGAPGTRNRTWAIEGLPWLLGDFSNSHTRLQASTSHGGEMPGSWTGLTYLVTSGKPCSTRARVQVKRARCPTVVVIGCEP